MRYGMTIVYVPDPEQTAIFWQRAFGFQIRTIFEDNSYSDLKPRSKDDVSIGFVNSHDFEDMYGMKFGNQKLSRTQLMFNSDNVDYDFDRAIRNGAQILLSPHKTYWSERVAYVIDPNETVVIISGQMNPDIMNKPLSYLDDK